jgi:hypothetical protein
LRKEMWPLKQWLKMGKGPQPRNTAAPAAGKSKAFCLFVCFFP